jgi:hypothetical protein
MVANQIWSCAEIIYLPLLPLMIFDFIQREVQPKTGNFAIKFIGSFPIVLSSVISLGAKTNYLKGTTSLWSAGVYYRRTDLLLLPLSISAVSLGFFQQNNVRLNIGSLAPQSALKVSSRCSPLSQVYFPTPLASLIMRYPVGVLD